MLPFAQRTLQGDVGLTVLSAPTLTVQRESPPFGTLRRGTAARAAAAALRNLRKHHGTLSGADETQDRLCGPARESRDAQNW